MRSILNPDDGGRSWQQLTQSDYVTKVCFYHSMQHSQDRGILAASLSVLLNACATHGYDSWINGQLKKDGISVVIVHTSMLVEGVSALIAKHMLKLQGFIVTAETVKLPLDSTINAAIRQQLSLLASTGWNNYV